MALLDRGIVRTESLLVKPRRPAYSVVGCAGCNGMHQRGRGIAVSGSQHFGWGPTECVPSPHVLAARLKVTWATCVGSAYPAHLHLGGVSFPPRPLEWR
jgi:hypothetical protein